MKSATLLPFTCFRVWIFQVFAADLCKNLDSFLNVSAQDDHETFYNTSCTIVLHMQDHWSSLDYLPYIKKKQKSKNQVKLSIPVTIFQCIHLYEKHCKLCVILLSHKNTIFKHMSILYCTVLPSFPLVHLHYFSDGNTQVDTLD